MAKLTYDLTYLIRLMAKYAQEIPAWRELTGSVAELCLNRMFQYGAFHDWVEQAGLDPNGGTPPVLLLGARRQLRGQAAAATMTLAQELTNGPAVALASIKELVSIAESEGVAAADQKMKAVQAGPRLHRG
jgi:hypothetical protein